MPPEEQPQVAVAERVRRHLAAPVAFLASALGVVCVASVPDVLPAVDDLALVDARFVGWAGVGAAGGLVLAAVALLSVGRVGSGPALSLGAAGSVFGLALAQDVVDPFQLSLALVILGGSVGCLLAGGASMTFELPAPYRHRSLAAWCLPVAAAWPLLGWLSLHVDATTGADSARLTMHPSVWLLAPVSAVIVLWSALTMLVEPDRAGLRSDLDWDPAWSALVAVTLGGGLVIMVLGFDPGIDAGWLRPLILLSAAALVASLSAATVLVPDPAGQVGYVCLGFVLLCIPTSVQLLVIVADGGSARVSTGVVALLVGATTLGAVLGGRRVQLAVPGFLLVAASCAGAWVMPETQGLMAASGVPLCLGAGVVFGVGVRRSSATAVGWRFAVMTVVAVVLLGTVASVALGWALGGDVAADTASARAAGRVFLGLTFAMAVVAAAVVSVLAPRPVSDGRRSHTHRAPTLPGSTGQDAGTSGSTRVQSASPR